MRYSEYYPLIDTPPNEVFYKVARASGAAATSGSLRLVENEAAATPELSLAPPIESASDASTEIEIKLDYHRRGALERIFPEFTDIPDAELKAIVLGFPQLIAQGRDRFPPKQKVENQMEIFYNWLEGKTQAEIRRQGNAASANIGNLLRSLRKNFTLEEITEGHVLESADRDWHQQEFLKNFQRLFAQAYPDEDLSGITFEQAEQITSALYEVSQPRDRERFEKMLSGMSLTQILKTEGLKQSGRIYTWRKKFLSIRLARNIDFASLNAALQSDEPQEELARLFSKLPTEKLISKSASRTVAKTAAVRNSQASTSSKSEASKSAKSQTSEPNHGPKVVRSSTISSEDYWKGHAKKLEKHGRPLVGDELNADIRDF